MSVDPRLSLAALIVALIMTSARAEDSFSSALSNGDLGLDLRYRYEFVDQDGFDTDARASTLRTRLNYASGAYRDFSLFLEFDDISPIGGETYNSTTNGRTDRPVVADPEGTEVNQAWLQWTGLAQTQLRFGRQRIIFDNHRFVGNVGWRQNEQTYDGFTIVNRYLSDMELTYGYVYNVNRVFGPDDGAQLADWGSDTHLLHGHYTGFAPLDLTGYVYLIDLDEAPDLSNQTFGVRALGNWAIDADTSFHYTLEFAYQRDYGDNPVDYSAPYWLLEAGVRGLGAVDLKLGYEVLSGDEEPGRRFVTPLATLHAHQGWADQILVTPDGGIEDLYFAVSTELNGVKFTGVYHEFSPETGGGDYGSELDLSLGHRFGDRYDVLLKFAGYDEDGLAIDTTKIWLMLSASF